MSQEGREEYRTGRKSGAGGGGRKPDRTRIHREGGYDSRRRSRKKKKKAGRRSWIKWAALGVLAVLAAAAVGMFLWLSSIFGKIQREEGVNMAEMTNPNIDTTTQRVMRENWTIAVFGVDSADGNLGKGANADVIMLCNINEKTGAIRIVSIYRDTCMKVGEKNPYKKINEAYARGGIGQAVEALNENLDIEIDDYVAVNWKAVADAINLLGGIDMEITEAEFKYINAYITSTVEGTGVGSYQLKSAGMNHLDGIQTVAYARLRYMDSDFQRTERQRKVLAKVLEKAKQADWSVLNNILVGVLPQTKSSFQMDSLIPLAKNITKFHLDETEGFPFDLETKRITENGHEVDYVFPTDLESNVVKLHEFLYGTEDYEPSEKVKEISAAIEEKSKKTVRKKPSVQKTTEAPETEESVPDPENESAGEPTTEGFSPTAEELLTTGEAEETESASQEEGQTQEIGPGIGLPDRRPEGTQKEPGAGPGSRPSQTQEYGPGVTTEAPQESSAADPGETEETVSLPDGNSSVILGSGSGQEAESGETRPESSTAAQDPALTESGSETSEAGPGMGPGGQP